MKSWPDDAQGFRIGEKGEEKVKGKIAGQSYVGLPLDEKEEKEKKKLNSWPIVRKAIRLKVHVRMLRRIRLLSLFNTLWIANCIAIVPIQAVRTPTPV